MDIKKEYVAPEMEVIRMDVKPELMACSTDPSGCLPIGSGDDDNGRQ